MESTTIRYAESLLLLIFILNRSSEVTALHVNFLVAECIILTRIN